VAGFHALYQKLERSITVSGYSHSTLTNYSRCLAKMAQHFNMNPILLDEDRIAEATGVGLPSLPQAAAQDTFREFSLRRSDLNILYMD